MALQESGLKLVAKDAERFFRNMGKVNNLYAKILANQEKVAASANKTFDNITAGSKKSSAALKKDYTAIAKAAEGTAKASERVGKKTKAAVDPAANSVAKLQIEYREAKKALEQLDRADVDFDKQAAEVQQLNRQLVEYRRQIAGTRGDTKAAEGSYEQLRLEVNRLEKEYKQLGQAQREGLGGQQLRNQINKTKNKLKEIDTSLGDNRRNVGNYSSALEGLTGQFPLMQLGAIGAVTAIGTAVKQFADESLVEFQQFETGMAEVFTLLPNASGAALSDMTGQVQDFALESGRLTDDVVPALYQSLSAGVPEENVFDFLEVASQAARGGVTDLQTSVDTLSSVVNAYGEDVISVGQASDAIFTAVRLGKTTFGEIGSSISNVTPLAASLGVRFQDVAAAIAVLTAQGTPTAQAVTQISAVLSELVKPTSEVSKLFRDITNKSFREFIAEGGNMQQALDIIAQGAKDAGIELAGIFGRKEGLLATLALAGDNADAFAKALDEVNNAAGATGDAAGQFNDTLEIARNRANTAAQALKLAVGQALSPYEKAWLAVKSATLEGVAAQVTAANSTRDLRKESREASREFQQIAKDARAIAGVGEAVDGVAIRIRNAFSVEDEARAFQSATKLIQAGFQGTTDELIELIKVQLRASEVQENLNRQQGNASEAYAEAADASRENAEAEREAAAAIAESAQARERNRQASLRQKQANEQELATKQANARATLDFMDATDALNQAVADGLIDRQTANSLLVQAAGDADFLTAATERLTAAQIAQGQATRQAISAAGDRIGNLISPSSSGGGGGRDPRVELENELATLRQNNAATLASIEANNAASVAKTRLKAEDDIEKARAAGLANIASAEEKLAEARVTAEKKINAERARGFLDSALSEDGIDVDQDAIDRLRRLGESGELTTEQLADLARATGVLNDEQIAAGQLEEQRRQTLDALDEAYANGQVSAAQYAEATRIANEQLAAGLAIDLSEFGISPESVAAYVERTTTAERDALAAAKSQMAADVLAIETQLTADLETLQNDLATKTAAAQAKLATAIEKAQGRAKDAYKSSGGAAKKAADTYQQTAVKQLLAMAAQEKTTKAQLAGTKSALDLAVQFGLLTQAQADEQFAAAQLDATYADLIASQEFVRLGANDQREAIELLQSGIVKTKDEAIEFAKRLSEDAVAALIAVKDDSVRLKEKLDELKPPTEIQIVDNTADADARLDNTQKKLTAVEDSDPHVEIFVASDEANANIDGVQKNLDETRDKTVTLTVNEVVNRSTGGGANEGFTEGDNFHGGGRPKVGKPAVVGDGPNGQILPNTEVIVPDSPLFVIPGSMMQTAKNALMQDVDLQERYGIGYAARRLQEMNSPRVDASGRQLSPINIRTSAPRSYNRSVTYDNSKRVEVNFDATYGNDAPSRLRDDVLFLDGIF